MNKNVEQLKYDIYQPFGPSVLKIKMPQQFVNLLNAEADRILHDEKLSKEHDWSHNLACNVNQEVGILPNNIPITNYSMETNNMEINDNTKSNKLPIQSRYM